MKKYIQSKSSVFYFILSVLIIFSKEAMAQYPKLDDAYYLQKGIVLQKQGKLDEALAMYEKGLKLNPKNVDLLYNVGAVYIKKEKFRESVRVLEKVVKLNPNDGEAYYNLAAGYFHLEKMEKAIECYDKAKKLGFPVEEKFGDILNMYRPRKISMEYTPMFSGEGKVTIEIEGFIAGDNMLLRDTIRNLEILSGVPTYGMFERIKINYVSEEKKEGVLTSEWLLLWGNGRMKEFLIRYIKSPYGGVDIFIVKSLSY